MSRSSGQPMYTVNVAQGAQVTLNVMTAAEVTQEEPAATAAEHATSPSCCTEAPSSSSWSCKPPLHEAPGHADLDPAPSSPLLPRWTARLPPAAAPNFSLFAAISEGELPGPLLAGYRLQVERLNSEVLELRARLAEEHEARVREALLYKRGLAAEACRTRGAERRAVLQFLSTTTLYATRSTGGKRFHRNPLCGSLHDAAPRHLTYCLECSDSSARGST